MRGSTPPRPPARPGDGIYRIILWVMVVTVVLGAALAIVGETQLQDPALGRLGVAIAVIGAAVYAFFRILGAREARRRQERTEADSQP
jgi:threonine/homoserine efflux transporter RhtA